nr:L,D-transpeptidase family protein [Sphingomonas sp.]
MLLSSADAARTRKSLFLGAIPAVILASAAALAQPVDVGSGSAAETVARLKPGEYVWAPQVAPSGPALLFVNLKSQRAILYRNGIPIGATTVSTGRPGFETPTGVFTILQKHVEHYSNKYDNAPMPYMERLTWTGVALHAGQLPGYPASHGCIRLPRDFARLLYSVTTLGMTVVVSDQPAIPRLASGPDMAMSAALPKGVAAVEWHPEKAPAGPVSILVSSADRTAIVLRNGIVIGSAPVTIEGEVKGSWVYALRADHKAGLQWIRMALSDASEEVRVPREEWQRFRAPEEFRRAVAGIVQPGTTVIVTSDTLNSPAAGETGVTVIESEPRGR